MIDVLAQENGDAEDDNVDNKIIAFQDKFFEIENRRDSHRDSGECQNGSSDGLPIENKTEVDRHEGDFNMIPDGFASGGKHPDKLVLMRPCVGEVQ